MKHQPMPHRNGQRIAYKIQKIGLKPGLLLPPPGGVPPRLFLMSYHEETLIEQEFVLYQDLYAFQQNHPHLKHWIDVRGYDNVEMLERFITDFSIHPLQMEDVLSEQQRPKLEEFESRLFITSRMINFLPDREIEDDQLSIFTGPNYVITFQKDYDDCLEPLRERIRAGKGIIRKRPVIYLCYAIQDVVLDNYFPVMAKINEYLEHLEIQVFEHPSRQVLNETLKLKKNVARLRRIVWPERDKINELLRLDEHIIPANLKIYFKDVYDHSVQVIDLIDHYKDMTNSLVEIYLSQVSNRMNEIMKVLTIISSIFIPLSFIVGIYGMNFSRENPETGAINKLNMPELYHPYGYPILVCVMLLLIAGQLYFFYRKGWLGKNDF